MIYRLIVNECFESVPSGRGRLAGLTNSIHLSHILDELRIRMPSIENMRARFYFTEAGWRRAGRVIAGEARHCGHVVRCVRRKEPDASQVVYRDEDQIAILPARRPKRKGGRA